MEPPRREPSTIALTPRQDRLEAEITALLSGGSSRSELREAVYQLADALRTQRIGVERAVALAHALVERAAPAMAARGPLAVGAAPADCAEMMERWIATRYRRAD